MPLGVGDPRADTPTYNDVETRNFTSSIQNYSILNQPVGRDPPRPELDTTEMQTRGLAAAPEIGARRRIFSRSRANFSKTPEKCAFPSSKNFFRPIFRPRRTPITAGIFRSYYNELENFIKAWHHRRACGPATGKTEETEKTERTEIGLPVRKCEEGEIPKPAPICGPRPTPGRVTETGGAADAGSTRGGADRDTALSYSSYLSYRSCPPAKYAVGGGQTRQRRRTRRARFRYEKRRATDRGRLPAPKPRWCHTKF